MRIDKTPFFEMRVICMDIFFIHDLFNLKDIIIAFKLAPNLFFLTIIKKKLLQADL